MAVTVRREEPPAETGGAPPHLWQDPRLAEVLEAWWLVARRGERTVATWLVPVEATAAGPVARRRVRALPYAAPRIREEASVARREVLGALVRHLQEHVQGIELPLDLELTDFGAFCDHGAFLEARHTHVVDSPYLYESRLPRRARNHLRAAAVEVELHELADVATFPFEQAVLDAPQDHVDRRRRLAVTLARQGRARALAVRRGSQVVGGTLALDSQGHWLVVHSWFDRECGIRGIPTLLLDGIIRTCFAQHGAWRVDLEGSILATVDRFMDGMGARPAPYALVYWYPQRSDLLARLEGSLDIPGRKRHAGD